MLFRIIKIGLKCISFSITSAIVLYILIEFTGFGNFWNSVIPSWNAFSFFDRAIILISLSIAAYFSVYVGILIIRDHKTRFESMQIHVKSTKKKCIDNGGKWSKKGNQKCTYKDKK